MLKSDIFKLMNNNDFLKRRTAMSSNDKKNAIINAVADIELVPVDNSEKYSEYTKIPFAEISLLGGVFSSIPAFFNSGAGETLYKAVSANGVPINLPYLCKNGVGFSSGYMENGHVASAHFIETQGATTVLQPATLFMSIALIQMSHKLDNIQKKQVEILNFLQDDKKAKLEGNLLFLEDVANNYKHNWNNETYRQNTHVKVQDIEQESRQDIVFYTKQIRKAISKRNKLNTGKTVQHNLDSLQFSLNGYRLSLYLYSFSLLLEIMLLENFDSKYIKDTMQKIDRYSQEYRLVYTDVYNYLEKELNASASSTLLKGVSHVSSASGNVIAKIPVISKSQLDENLIKTGSSINDHASKKANDILQSFADNHRDTNIDAVKNVIDTIDKLYNKSTEILLDVENLYLGFSQK